MRPLHSTLRPVGPRASKSLPSPPCPSFLCSALTQTRRPIETALSADETLYEKTRDFQRESAAINKSLMALKDCFREAARARERRARRERAAGGLPYSTALKQAKAPRPGLHACGRARILLTARPSTST